MNNKIFNKQVEVPKGVELNDKDYLNSLLSCLKDMAKNYVIFQTEASNEDLYENVYESFLEISNQQRNVYNVMFQKGWYKLEKAPINKIENKLEEISQEFNDLNI